MLFKKSLIAIAAISCAAGVAFAQDPISERQAAMKSVGGAAKQSAMMIKGEKPYDAEEALAALQKMNDVAQVFGTYFPEGSEIGGKTTAASAIWSDRAGFDAAIAKFEADSAAAIASAPVDLEAFKVAFGSVAANCGTCHKAYRVSN